MDDTRYQVFVSSTYADLRDERGKVIQTLMEMDCIPAGMELFPAADEEQWEFIKRVINDCDYYILVIGGRYGSTTSEGISYTEKEYDYAIEKGLKVLAFIHENPDEIPVCKSDIDPALRVRLAAFRNKVSKGRLVKLWKATEELPGLVSLSLSKTMKTYPAVGWVRADQGQKATIAGLLKQMTDLIKRNQELELEKFTEQMTHKNRNPKVENLASLDEEVIIQGKHFLYGSGSIATKWECKTTWKDLFVLIAPYLLEHPNDKTVNEILTSSLYAKTRQSGTNVSIDDQLFQTIKIQLMAFGLVDIQYLKTVAGGMALFWSLTSQGRNKMMELRTVKRRRRRITSKPPLNKS